MSRDIDSRSRGGKCLEGLRVGRKGDEWQQDHHKHRDNGQPHRLVLDECQYPQGCDEEKDPEECNDE